MKNILIPLITLLMLFPNVSFSQDFIRIGAAHDFEESKIVQTFSFDFNRTENIKEKVAKYIYFKNNFYILPNSDINIGDGVTASENNILFQVNLGKLHYGHLRKSADRLTTNQWSRAFEINPSYNSDKLFAEKLIYGQLKILLNFTSSKHNGTVDPILVKRVHSWAAGLYTNLGYRKSETYETSNSYSTIGLLLDYKTRLLNDNSDETWVFKINGNYYYIASDVELLTTDDFGGIIKISIDRLALKNTYLGLSYKYGNDNPGYKYVHTIELSLKIKY